MNRLIAALAAVCRQQVTREKRLLAPSRRIGHQWVRQVARGGTPAVNLRPTPLKALAFELAAPALLREGSRLLPAQARLLLVERLWADWRKRNPRRYLTQFEGAETLAPALDRTLATLRLGGVQPADLVPEAFEVAEKGHDLAELLLRYEQTLRKARLRDEADLFQLAVERVLENPAALGPRTLLLIPADQDAQGLARRLLDQLPAEVQVSLPVDQPGDTTDAPATNLGRLRFLDAPAAAPPPCNDASVGLFTALGETAELRECLRRVLAEGTPFDEVEILVTDAEAYVPRLHELSRGLPGQQGDAIPMNFADGLPARLSLPGRALRGWLDWLADDGPQWLLVDLLREGVLVPTKQRDHSPLETAELLARLPVGRGRSRYLPAVVQAKAHAADPAEKVGLIRLEELLRSLLALWPERGSSDQKLADTERFLAEFTPGDNELDNFSREHLLAAVADQRRWLRKLRAEDFQPLSWLRSTLDSLRVLQQGPMPGLLHVSSWDRGGHSGRRRTFLLGMDEDRLRLDGGQDPLLLDREKTRLSPELRTQAQTAEVRQRERLHLLCRLRGRLEVSYPCRDLADDASRLAGPLFLSIAKLILPEPPRTAADLETSLAPVAGFLPPPEGCVLTEGEAWLQRLMACPRPENGNSILKRFFPNAAEGAKADAARQKPALSAYDGRVPEAGIDPGAPDGLVLSAAQLEELASCPRRFFFSQVLRLTPPPELERDPARWLGGNVEGSLLHGLFHAYHSRLLALGQKPDFRRDAAWLQAELDRRLAEWSEHEPPPSAAVAETDRLRLEATLRLFLSEEAEEAGQSTPVFLEAALGLPLVQPGSALDREQPVSVDLGDGRTLRLRGRVDRVDRLNASSKEFLIWDYKTGGLSRYTDKALQTGRLLQPLTYLLMVEQCLREVVGPEARVTGFGYYFLGRRGQGDRRLFGAEALRPLQGKLRTLSEMLRLGLFPATETPDECTYCAFQRICSQPEDAERTLELMSEGRTPPLALLARLRNDQA